jgi:hypothetical protein
MSRSNIQISKKAKRLSGTMADAVYRLKEAGLGVIGFATWKKKRAAIAQPLCPRTRLLKLYSIPR